MDSAPVTFDPVSNAMYVAIDGKKQKIAKTIPLGKGTYLDVSENGSPLGLKVLLPGTPNKEIVSILSKLPELKTK